MREWRRLALENAADHVGRRITGERQRTGHHLVQHHTETPDVAARIDVCAAGLLRRHVRRRPDDDSFARERRLCRRFVRLMKCFRQLRDAEVEHLYVAVSTNHHVFRLHIAMHDAFLVRGGNPCRGLRSDVQQRVQREGAVVHRLAERLAFDQLARDVIHAVGLADVIDGDDIRMIQREHRARFLQKARHVLGIANVARSQGLQRDAAPHPVYRAIDLAHAAGAKRSLDRVRADARRDRRRRKQCGRGVCGRRFDERARAVVCTQQRVDFGVQLGIAHANFCKE